MLEVGHSLPPALPVHDALELQCVLELGAVDESGDEIEEPVSGIEDLRYFLQRVVAEGGLGGHEKEVVHQSQGVEVDDVHDEIGAEEGLQQSVGVCYQAGRHRGNGLDVLDRFDYFRRY